MTEDSQLITKAAQAMFTPAASTEAVVETGSQAEIAEPQTPPADTQVSAGMAVDTPAEPAAQVPEPAAVAPEPQPAVTNEPYNYWAELEQKTEGLVKDEETFNSILEKSKNYETLAAEKAELEKNQWKPANDYISTLDTLVRNGAKPDQIKAFVKLNEYGDLDALVNENPIQARIARLVLIDGYSEEVAVKKANREFDFAQFDETEPDQKDDADILREELKVTARKDLEALKEYRKDLSVVPNPEKESAEAARLAEIAQISTYNKTVEQEAPKIAGNFPPKLAYEFKIGDESINFEDTIEKEFLEKQLPNLVADYFKDSLDPVNAQTISEAYSYAFGEYLKANDGKRLERAYQKGFTEATERTVNKYENRSGLPKAQENTLIAANEDGLTEFTRKMLGKK